MQLIRKSDKYADIFKRIGALLIDLLFVLAGITVFFLLLAGIMVLMTSINVAQLQAILAELQALEARENYP